ncbi:hypothetical protein [Ekhidna sp.]|uniref:hypothetical protein n=1 Tax=Ekhidna sp. TaxID=2608089 RepID=UPI003B50C12F
MESELKEKLSSLPSDFLPIKNFVNKYAEQESRIDNLGTIQLVKNTQFTEAYFIKLFEGAPQLYFDNFLIRYNLEIPESLKSFFRIMNGFHFYDFTIYGLTPSLYKSTDGLLDRTMLQPLDIGTANEYWKHEFERSDFHFGTRYFDDEQNCGYFLEGDTILSCLTTGEIVRTWTNFSDFLTSELTITEQNETDLNSC